MNDRWWWPVFLPLLFSLHPSSSVPLSPSSPLLPLFSCWKLLFLTFICPWELLLSMHALFQRCALFSTLSVLLLVLPHKMAPELLPSRPGSSFIHSQPFILSASPPPPSPSAAAAASRLQAAAVCSRSAASTCSLCLDSQERLCVFVLCLRACL